MNTGNNKAFGLVLRELRNGRHWSQEHLGFEAELTRAYISLLERGLRSPTLDTLISLCGAFGITLSALAARIDQVLQHKGTQANG